MERALASALTVCNDQKIYRALGFVRLSDYVREILGISIRSAQEMIRTEKALKPLTWTSFWWEMGTLHKEQVRLLCRVATSLTEQNWIFQAQRLSVRELAAKVKEHADAIRGGLDAPELGVDAEPALAGSSEGEGGACGEVGIEPEERVSGARDRGDPDRGEGEEDEGERGDRDVGDRYRGEGDREEDEEDFASVSFRAPLAEARRWRNTLRLCRDVCEAELPDWSLVESLCAEYLAGAPQGAENEDTGDFSPPGTGGDGRADREGTRSRADAAEKPDIDTPGTGGAVSRQSGIGKPLARCDACERNAEHDAHDPANGREAGPFEAGDGSIDPPTSTATASASAADAGPPGSRGPAFTAGTRKPWLPRELEAFLEDSTPTDPLALHERIVRLAELRSRLEAMLSHRLYELMYRDETRHVGHGDVKSYASEVLGIGERRARYLLSLERRLYGAPVVRDEFRRGGLSWLRCWMLLRVVRGEESELAWVAYAKQVTVLRLRDAIQDAEVRIAVEYPCLPPKIGGDEGQGRHGEWQVSAREDDRSADDVGAGPASRNTDRETERLGERRMGRIRFSAPLSVVALWNRAVAEVRRAGGRHLLDWEAASRMLDGFMETWDGQLTRQLRHEHRIMERDGWRCTVPACSSKQDLHAHHVKFRSHGGEDEDWNLTTLCVSHHLHAVHGFEAGTVTVAGRAPLGLHWELGGGLGGPPVLVFEGERCVFRWSGGLRAGTSRAAEGDSLEDDPLIFGGSSAQSNSSSTT